MKEGLVLFLEQKITTKLFGNIKVATEKKKAQGAQNLGLKKVSKTSVG
jgi:hypothetical protein